MTTLTELLARWDADEGKPYKGRLIDWDAHNLSGGGDTPNLGCMCAQGQVLHLLAGWTPEKLHETSIAQSDKAVAAELNISVAHAASLRIVNDSAAGAPSVVITDPSKVLGEHWSKVLDFWVYLDGMTAEQRVAWDAAGDAGVAWAAAGAAGAAAGAAGAAWDARAAAWAAAGAAGAARDAAWAATNEIQGAAVMHEKSQPFMFLPMFGFASPKDLPARPDNYGPFSGVAA